MYVFHCYTCEHLICIKFEGIINGFSPFTPGVAFVIETSHLICNANQMIGFYMKFNTGTK